MIETLLCRFCVSSIHFSAKWIRSVITCSLWVRHLFSFNYFFFLEYFVWFHKFIKQQTKFQQNVCVCVCVMTCGVLTSKPAAGDTHTLTHTFGVNKSVIIVGFAGSRFHWTMRKQINQILIRMFDSTPSP